MRIKHILCTLGALILMGGLASSFSFLADAQSGLWYPSSNRLRPVVDTWGLQIPALVSCTGDIETDASGILSCGTDASGGSNWQFIGPNAIRPTSTVGIIVNASSTFTGQATTSFEGNINIISTENPQLFIKYDESNFGSMTVNDSGELIFKGSNITFIVPDSDSVGYSNVSEDKLIYIDFGGNAIYPENPDEFDLGASSNEFNNLYLSGDIASGDNLTLTYGISVATGTFTGGIIVSASSTFQGDFAVSSLTNCDTIDTDASGLFACGSDETAGAGVDGSSNWKFIGTENNVITPTSSVGIFINASSTFYDLTVRGLQLSTTTGFIANSSTTFQDTVEVGTTLTVGTLTDGTLTITGGAITSATGLISQWTNDGDYLTWANASNTYPNIGFASTTYLSWPQASSTYISWPQASSTYFSIRNWEFAGPNALSPTSSVGIIVNASSTMGTTTFYGEVDIIHTAFANDDHTLELITDLAGFGGVHALDIVFETGAISAGEDEAAILINIDESGATGGDIFGIQVLSTAEGTDDVYALKVGATINPISQLSGTFGNMDSASTTVETDDLAAFIDTGTDVSIFDNDNDAVTIGDAAKFEEIEFVFATMASNPGIKPVFEFYNGSIWVVFAPIDGTNGMRNSGIIAWDDADIPTWATDGNTEYAIRISRTANSLGTVPTEDIVQISAVVIYKWDKAGYITAAGFSGNASTADALLANGANCTNQFPLGVDASGAVESCTTITTAYMDLTDITLSDFINDTDYITGSYVTSTYPSFAYASSTYVMAKFATSTFMPYSYASSTYPNFSFTSTTYLSWPQASSTYTPKASTTLDFVVSVPNLATVGTLTAGASGAGFTVDLDSSTLTCTNCVDIGDNTNLTVGATGIELSGDDIALTAGYNIPADASTTDWNITHQWYNTYNTYIDQDVTSGSSPTLDNANITGNISVYTNDSGYFSVRNWSIYDGDTLIPTSTAGIIISASSTFQGTLDSEGAFIALSVESRGVASSTSITVNDLFKVDSTGNTTSSGEFVVGADGAAQPGCLAMRDHDASGGWTYCRTIDGTMTCDQNDCTGTATSTLIIGR